MKRPDEFFPASPEALLSWMLSGLASGEVFGISESLFFRPDPADPFRSSRYGRLLETPLGVAAGPHSQMAQNIVSAWLCGARFIELKTVQVLDELAVTKPCIDASDEGYNCEWSQELRLSESFGQYLAAMILLTVLRRELGHPGEDPGFILNMSAGYDLKGVKSPAMARFLDRMVSCPDEVRELRERLAPLYPAIREIALPDGVSDNLTLSTMHGCPPEEVERIARYFLEERGLNTCVKLNPTLLGPEGVRGMVNGRLGYPVDIPDEAFGHDLAFDQAVGLIESLAETARKAGRHFGVKLTNTLEVVNRGNLPGSEKMLYLSGRALHPVSVALAARLRERFGQGLDISFCAGADAFNVSDIAGAGLTPVTLCTELLKPGGYGRLRQCVEALRGMKPVDLPQYAARAAADPRYRKDARPWPSIKAARPLPVFDCAAAPCMENCAAGQDIPGYLGHAAVGDFRSALAVIKQTNPFPNLLGKACDRQCRQRCTRTNYDRPLRIREVKAVAAREGSRGQCVTAPGDVFSLDGPVKTDASACAAQAVPSETSRVAVSGRCLEGFSLACFLARTGLGVDVYGESPSPDAALLASEAGRKDLDAILALGVGLAEGPAPKDALPADNPAKGPAGLPAAVARGRRAAMEYLAGSAGHHTPQPATPAMPDLSRLAVTKAARDMGPDSVETAAEARRESSRCLRCDLACGVCVTVCPNRANVAIPWASAGRPDGHPLERAVRHDDGVAIHSAGRVRIVQLQQIVNIADFCNRCGNCATFCPTSGAPYRDKFRLHLSRESFEADGQGAWFDGSGRMLVREGGRELAVSRDGASRFVAEGPDVRAVLDAATFSAVSADLSPDVAEASLALAARAALLYDPLSALAAVFGNHAC